MWTLTVWNPLVLGARGLLFAACGLLLPGCSGDKSDTAGGADSQDSGVDSDSGGGGECTDDPDCVDGQICEDAVCVDGDRNNAVDEAEPILWDDTIAGTLNPAYDVDYYQFAAEGGEYVRVEVVTGNEDDQVVLTVRESNGKVVTSAIGYATGTGVTGVSAVAFGYLAEADDYVLSVEDIGTYDGSGGSGALDYTYELTLEEWSQNVVESDSRGDPGVSIDYSDERIWQSVGALVGEAGDSDWIGVDYAISGQNFYVDGNQDLTGSDLLPLVRLRAADGSVLSEKRDVGPSEYLLYPHLSPGDYTVEVTDAEGGGSANHWAFAHLISRPDTEGFEFVDEVEPNDSQGQADELPMVEFENDGGRYFKEGQAVGWIDASDDEDWWQLTSTYASTGMVVCLASTPWGSLIAPTVEIYDDGGTLLGSDVGDASAYPTANLDSIDVAPGTYYLRVVAPGASVYGAGAWYRFIWYAADFSVSPYADGGYSCP